MMDPEGKGVYAPYRSEVLSLIPTFQPPPAHFGSSYKFAMAETVSVCGMSGVWTVPARC